jgi:demethylmenaquinone methyltransferase/2-methoxy-6-polyprenyl-1,4-benzoquinol methylase
MRDAPPKAPVPAGDAKRSYVRAMFTAIAPRYDLLNHLLSLNIDKVWRRRAVNRLGFDRVPDGTYLDSCAGTLDLGAELARRTGFRGRVVGADFVVPMLKLGRGKSGALRPVGADALRLPFADAMFDGALVGFGVRNLADLDAGLRELGRVLRPGARLVVLELTIPPAQPLRALYIAYFRHVLPAVGRAVSKHTDAYTYLPASVTDFPPPDDLARRMQTAGLRNVGYERMTFGIAAVHWGTK